MCEYLLFPFVEIEIRLGTLSKTFDNNVDKKYFNQIKESLNLNKNYFKTIEVKNTIEYINSYENSKSEKSENFKNLKLISSNSEKSFELMIKENILNKTHSLSYSPFDIKLSINQEFSLNNFISSFQKNGNCTIRKKERTSFIHTHFRYDLTIVNETINNSTRQKYEIELELIVNDETLTWSTQYINDFIECKIYDLIKIVEPLERDKFKLKLFV